MQDGHLPVVNGGIIPINGLNKKDTGFFSPTDRGYKSPHLQLVFWAHLVVQKVLVLCFVLDKLVLDIGELYPFEWCHSEGWDRNFRLSGFFISFFVGV